MSLGPGGKYEKECEDLCEKLEAEACMLIVGDGIRGSGFSVTIRPKNRHPLLTLKAAVLSIEDVAQQMRVDIARIEHEMAKAKANQK